MNRAEEEMWWYRALHSRFVWGLKRFCKTARPFVVDIGCGTGGLLKSLRRDCPCRTLGIDYSVTACAAARHKSESLVVAASANDLPLAPNTADAILLSDILCQDGIFPDATIKECIRCLKPGGIVLVNVPAYAWLRSRHDELVHAARRFTRPEMAALLEAQGLAVVQKTYWNTLPFPLMVLRRKLFSSRKGSSDVLIYPRPLELFFRTLMAIEGRLLAAGIRLPFGGSVFVVARKPA